MGIQKLTTNNDLIFLDTSGWISLLNSDDRGHSSAVRAWREVILWGKRIVLTGWIIAETGNGLARSPRRAAFVESIRLLPSSPEFNVVPIVADIFVRSVDLHAARPDKGWGLVDCASFVVMSDLGILDAFTTDRHFEQAGFRRLLPDPDRRDGESGETTP